MSKENKNRANTHATEMMGQNVLKNSQKRNMKQLIIILSVFIILLAFVVTFVVVFNQNKKSVIASQLETPQNVRIEETIEFDNSKYELLFEPVKYADYYSIYMFEGEDEVKNAIEEKFANVIPYINTTRTSVDVTNTIAAIGDYYFSVQAIYRKVESYSSLLSDPYQAMVINRYTLQTPSVVAQSTREGISVSWRSVSNATKYNVKYELNIKYKETDETLFETPQIISGNSYIVPQDVLNTMRGYAGNEFVVQVRATSENKFVKNGDNFGEADIFTYKYIEKPQITNYSFIGNKYFFEWNEQEYAEGYYVYINGNLAATLTNPQETSYEFEPEGYGKYNVSVRAFNTSKYIDDSEISDVAYLPDFRATTAPISNLYAERVNEQIRVSWNLESERTYYYVYIQNENEEIFEDLNNNGFYDIGESFVDANGNGVYDGGYITKPGSTEKYYEIVDSTNTLYFDLNLSPTGYYKISVKSLRQQEYFDPSIGFVRVIIRFDDTVGTKLATPKLSYEDASQNIVYGANSQIVQAPIGGDGNIIRTIFMAPRATDNNGFEIKIYEGESASGTLLREQIIPKVALELSTYRYSLTNFFNIYGAGKYYVTLKSLGGYLLFEDSDVVGTIVDHTIKLESPKNFSIKEESDDVVITFKEVEYASKYQIYSTDVQNAIITVNVDDNTITGGYLFTRVDGLTLGYDEGDQYIKITNVKHYFDDKNPGTYTFYAVAEGADSRYTRSVSSNNASFNLIKYVNTPILSHTSQLNAAGQDSNEYYVFWRYTDLSNRTMFDESQTFDVFVNGRKAVTNISFSVANLYTFDGQKYYGLEISEYALPGNNIVRVQANNCNNYLASSSEKEFKDAIIDGISVNEAYRYKIEYAYDFTKNVSVGGTRTESGVSYYIKFYSEKYANNFRFWFSKNNDDSGYSYEEAEADSNAFANTLNVYLSGFTNKETKIDIDESYFKFNGMTNIHLDVSFDITKDNKNNYITAERAGYIIGLNNKIINYNDAFHMEEVEYFDYDVLTNELTFKYKISQTSTIQTFVIYYKFDDDGLIKSIPVSKDDCLNRYNNGEIETISSFDYYVFRFPLNFNQVGKLFIKVVPANAVAIVMRDVDYKIYYTSQTLMAPQNLSIEGGVVSWSEVENASVYTSDNKVHPYTVQIYVDQDINDEDAIVYAEYDWDGTAINIFETKPELKNGKHDIFAKVQANAYKYALVEGLEEYPGTFSAKQDYIGHYVKVDDDYVLVTSSNVNNDGFIVTTITQAYYPQYRASEWSVSNVFAYTPSLIAPTVYFDSKNPDLLIIKKEQAYILGLEYELYLSDGNVLVYHQDAGDSSDIKIDIKNILITENGLGAGRYYLYAISKHTEWNVESPHSSPEVYYDITESLNPVDIVVKDGGKAQSYATRRDVQVEFKNFNDEEKLEGFEIYFQKQGSDISNNSVRVLGYKICVVKNSDGTFMVQLITNINGEWQDRQSTFPDGVSITLDYAYDEDTQMGVFTVKYSADSDIFTATKNYNVYVRIIGTQFYLGTNAMASINCFDGQFANPIIYVEEENVFYASADVSTNNVKILMRPLDGVRTANITIRNILNTDLNEIVVENQRLETVGGFFVYSFNPYSFFYNKLGIYEIYVQYNEFGYIQSSGQSNAVYVYYAYQGEGVESVSVETNISNLPLNLQITVNNSIYSNVDKSTFESFSVELLPIEDGEYIDNSTLGPTYLTLTEDNKCVIESLKGRSEGKYLTSKTTNANTTIYNFAIPISTICGFGNTWAKLDWNYVINASINYTKATNLNAIVNDITPVYVPEVVSKTKLSKYLIDLNLVVGKYYYDETLNEYIKILSQYINATESTIVVNDYTLQDTDNVYDLNFAETYATYESVLNNTYVGKYFYDSGIGGYKKIYSVEEERNGLGQITGLGVFDRENTKMDSLVVLGQPGQKSLSWDEYQFTTRSPQSSNTLTTSDKTPALVRVNIDKDGNVNWDGNTQTTYYYIYYAWDIATNTAKLFYNGVGGVNYYELDLSNDVISFSDGVFTCNFLNAEVSENYICLSNSLVYRKVEFSEDVYENVLNGANYYYVTAFNERIRLDGSNINGGEDERYLEPEGTAASYALTGAQVYEEMLFEQALYLQRTLDILFDALEVYYDVNNTLVKIEEAKLSSYADVMYVKAENLDIDEAENKVLRTITETNIDWQNKWLKVSGKGANAKTMFNIDSYLGRENYIYGTFIYAMKNGCTASKVLYQNFVPQFTYRISNMNFTATKSGNNVTRYLVFDDFDLMPFSYYNGVVLNQALITPEVRRALYKTINIKLLDNAISENEWDYLSNVSLNNGNVVVTLDSNIRNSDKQYKINIKTNDLMFNIEGKEFVVIPAIDISHNLDIPIIINENVSLSLDKQYYLGEGMVEYSIRFKQIDFATLYKVSITSKTKTAVASQDEEKIYFNDYEVIGSYSIRANVDNLTEVVISGNSYKYYEYDLTDFIESLSDNFDDDEYYFWIYVDVDSEKDIDSTLSVLDNEETDDFTDGTGRVYKISRENFIPYKKATNVENLVANFNDDIITGPNGESGKYLTFTTGQNEFDNSVYKVQIKDRNGNNVIFIDGSLNEFDRCYFTKLSSVGFSDGEVRILNVADGNPDNKYYYTYDSATNTYTVTLNITTEMINFPAGDYVAIITVVPISGDLLLSDDVESDVVKNNRKLVLKSNKYITMLVDGYVSEILNGEPLYYNEVLFDSSVYEDLSNNNYYYRDGNDFIQLTTSNVIYQGGTYYYNEIAISEIYVYSIFTEAENYLSTNNPIRKYFNDKQIITLDTFDLNDVDCVENWVSGLTSATGPVGAFLEIAFTHNGSYVPIGGNNWNSLDILLGANATILARDLEPGTYNIFARIKTNFDNGAYFKQIADDNGCVVTEEVEIYHEFDVYRRHMIGENIKTEIKNDGQFEDILVTTGINEANATYEIYFYDSNGNLAFKAANYVAGINKFIRTYDKDGNVLWTSAVGRALKQTSRNSKVSVYEFMLASNEVLTYDTYTVKFKWISSQADLNNNILNSDTAETAGVQIRYDVEQFVALSFGSNKNIVLDTETSYYRFETFADGVYVESYTLNIELAMPQINSTLVYYVYAKDIFTNRVITYRAYVKTTIQSFEKVGDAWIITYGYELLNTSSTEFTIVDNVLKFDLLPYVYGVDQVVGKYEYRATLEVKDVANIISLQPNNQERSINAIYEDVYATQLDKITNNETDEMNAITHHKGVEYQNLYLRNLELNMNNGVLTWEFADNLRFRMVSKILIVVNDKDGNMLFNDTKNVSENSSYDLSTILLADNSDVENFNNIEIYIVLREANLYWKVPSPLTNADIKVVQNGVEITMADSAFVWEPNLLDGGRVSGQSWSAGENPNNISFNLQFNEQYAKDTRLQEENTPYFTVEIWRMNYAEYTAPEYDFYDRDQPEKSIDEIVAINEGLSNPITIEYEKYSQKDWMESELFQEAVGVEGEIIKPGFNLAVKEGMVYSDGLRPYSFNLKELLWYVGNTYTELSSAEITAITEDNFALQYYLQTEDNYVLLSNYSDFETARDNNDDIFIKQNKWIKNVWTPLNQNEILPGQYFLKIKLVDGTNSGYVDGLIYEAGTHILEHWFVTDVQFVTDDFNVVLRNASATNKDVVQIDGKDCVQVAGKANTNLIKFTTESAITDENDPNYITESEQLAWVNNEQDVYLTFRVKSTGATLPHTSGLSIIHYYANTFLNGNPDWTIGNEDSFAVDANDWQGTDEDNYHVYVVNVTNIINNNKSQFGLHKFRVVVKLAQGQAYKSNAGTEAMADTEAYVNYVKLDTPTYAYEYQKGGNGENSGRFTIYVRFNFTNWLSNKDGKQFMVNLRAYENIETAEQQAYIDALEYTKCSISLSDSLRYEVSWVVELNNNNIEALQNIKKNRPITYESFVDVNGVSPFLINSSHKVDNHIIVDSYNAPKEFAYEMTQSDDGYYKNFVKESDEWFDVRDLTKYYSMSLTVDEGEAGRGVATLDASSKVAYLNDEDEICYEDAYIYYNLDGVNDSNKNNFHYFIVCVTKRDSNDNTIDVYTDYYFIVWYNTQTAATNVNGVTGSEQESNVYIRRVEFQEFVDSNVSGSFVPYNGELDANVEYYYFNTETEAYTKCATIEEAQQIINNSRKLYIYSTDAARKYMLKEYIELDDDQREIVGAEGAAKYENRYILRDGNYIALSTPGIYESLQLNGKIDENGILIKDEPIYAKQTVIPYKTTENVGYYQTSLNANTYEIEKQVVIENFGMPLKFLVDGNNFKKNVSNFEFRAKIFNETSYTMTSNSASRKSPNVNHFIEVDEAQISSVKFGLYTENGGVKEFAEETDTVLFDNNDRVCLLLEVSNINKAQAVNLIYEITRGEGESKTLVARNLITINLIRSNNGIRVSYDSDENEDKIYQILIYDGDAFSTFKQYLPGDVSFKLQAIGYVANNKEPYYAKDGLSLVPNDFNYPLDVFTKVTSEMKSQTANYINSQSIFEYEDSITVKKQLNIVGADDVELLDVNGKDVFKDLLSVGDDVDDFEEYLGANLEAIESDNTIFKVVTEFMLHFKEQFHAGEGLEDKVVSVYANFKDEEGNDLVTQKFVMNTSSNASPIISVDDINSNANIYNLLSSKVTDAKLIYVTFQLKYETTDDNNFGYWIASLTRTFAFYFYHSVEVKTPEYSNMVFDTQREIQKTDRYGNYYKIGYLVPKELTINFQKAEKDQPTDGYQIRVDYTVSGEYYGNEKDIFEMEAEATANSYNVLNQLFKKNRNESGFDITKQAWEKGNDIITSITPYYNVNDTNHNINYKIYGSEKSATHTLQLKLSNLRNLAVEYYYDKDFYNDWTDLDDISSSDLLTKARQQPNAEKKEGFAVGVYGLRGLWYEQAFRTNTSVFNSHSRTSHAFTSPADEGINYGSLIEDDRNWKLYVYTSSIARNPTATYDRKTATNLHKYFFNAEGVVEALNWIMQSKDGGSYYISYELTAGNNEIASGESGRYPFIYRKVYSDYDDISISGGTDMKVNISNSTTPNTTSYTNYPNSDTLKVTANIWQHEVTPKTGSNTPTVSSNWTKSDLGSSWTYSNASRTYSVDPSQLDALTFNAKDYATQKVATALTTRYGYIKEGTYGDVTYNNSNAGYLQLGKNKIQLKISGNSYNLGYNYLYGGDVSISLPSSAQINLDKNNSAEQIVGEDGTGAYYSSWDVQQNCRFQRGLLGPIKTGDYSNPFESELEPETFDHYQDVYNSNSSDSVIGMIYANILVSYEFYIRQLQYNVANRYNYIASFSDSNFEFKDNTQYSGDKVYLTLKASGKKVNKINNATLTLTPLFGDSYKSYGIVSKTLDRNLNVATEIALESKDMPYDDQLKKVAKVKTNTFYIWRQVNVVTCVISAVAKAKKEQKGGLLDLGDALVMYYTLKFSSVKILYDYPLVFSATATFEAGYSCILDAGWLGEDEKTAQLSKDVKIDQTSTIVDDDKWTQDGVPGLDLLARDVECGTRGWITSISLKINNDFNDTIKAKNGVYEESSRILK